MSELFRVALAQINPTVGDIDGQRRARSRDRIARARDEGAQLVVFPELALTGYPPEDLLLKTRFLDAARRRARGAGGADRGIVALVGLPPAGATTSTTRPRCWPTARSRPSTARSTCPNYGVFDEQRYFQSGPEPALVRGQRHPDRAHDLRGHLGARAARDRRGAGGRPGDREPVRLALPRGQGPRARADARAARPRQRRRGRVLQPGRRPGRARLRRPQRRDRPGRRDARARAAVRGGARLLHARPRRRRGRRLRDTAPPRRRARASARDARRPRRRARPEPRRRAAADRSAATRRRLLRPEEEVYSALRTGLRDYVEKNGFEHVVFGLSGGIDSALVALIAVDALGPGPRDLRVMPSPYSSEGPRRTRARSPRTSAPT